MSDIYKIIKVIDEFLVRKNIETTTPVEINPYLEKLGLLNDPASRPGLPVRKLLRNGKISHAFQIGVNWQIPHSGNNRRNLKPIQRVEIVNNTNPIMDKQKNCGHKLAPIGKLIVELIEKKYGEKPICEFEFKPEWLLSFPNRQ